MTGRTNIHEIPETTAVFERQLNDGSRLEYRMQVLQQPERARACGQGAKSHADRRPVDPPPVVELRLYQSSGNGQEMQDVTFSHNSNFLLYATLEQARPIAQGRGMPAPSPAPVLTGVPVSGMAYLDRPSPAGYFIFPDLSVRHEGKYRLRFALYEETKEEIYPVPADPLEPREFCTHRLDVKSKAFTVFSAKKFPGLAESTSLSRIVAEQGCRVRIRRDVRMRRRSDRPRSGEAEDIMDETALLRQQRGRTPPDQYAVESHIKSQNAHAPQYQQPQQPYMQQQQQQHQSVDRKRSDSDASVSMATEAPQPVKYEGYSTPVQNHGPYHPPAGSAPPPPQNSSQHFNYGTPHTAPPAPPHHIHPPQVHPQQDLYNQNRYQAPPPPQRSQHQYPGSGINGYQSREAPQQQPSRRPSIEDFSQRRGSDAGFHHQQQQQQPQQQQYARPPTPSMQPQYNSQPSYAHNQYSQPQPQPTYHAAPPPPPPQQQQQPAPQQNNSLPPIRLPSIIEPKLWSSQPTTPNTTTAPQLPKPTTYQPSTTPQPTQRAPPPPPPAPIAASAAPIPPASAFPAYYPEQKYNNSQEQKYEPQSTPASSQSYSTPQPDTKKRPWGRVFNPAHTEGPLHNGMRPNTNTEVYGGESSFAADTADDDDSYDIGRMQMSYRRADGVEIVRELPGYA